eukprot:TRINITY_DN8463_c0_g1_i1.p1 TRINITY_DN8463_c0_g1~~TRINITY_DN8463_c0_g1_i1.p1  ORF type:complete len:252 (-),score=64.78 TRINITY_DN8463_c0_g1_i1:8-763(-)
MLSKQITHISTTLTKPSYSQYKKKQNSKWNHSKRQYRSHHTQSRASFGFYCLSLGIISSLSWFNALSAEAQEEEEVGVSGGESFWSEAKEKGVVYFIGRQEFDFPSRCGKNRVVWMRTIDGLDVFDHLVLLQNSGRITVQDLQGHIDESLSSFVRYNGLVIPLEGEPWNWTDSKTEFVDEDGNVTGSSTSVFTKDGMTQVHDLGVFGTLKGEYVVVDAERYERELKEFYRISKEKQEIEDLDWITEEAVIQ